jgi:hypothetical protein
MSILRNILAPLHNSFQTSRKGPERGLWFVYTLLAVITHFTSSRTSNLLRCLQTLFELPLTQRRFYTLYGFAEFALAATVGDTLVTDSRTGR